MEAKTHNALAKSVGYGMKVILDDDIEEDWTVICRSGTGTLAEGRLRHGNNRERAGKDDTAPSRVALVSTSVLADTDNPNGQGITAGTLQSTRQPLQEVIDGIEQLETLRNEKQSCNLNFENQLQSVLDQNDATQFTMEELEDVKCDDVTTSDALQLQLVKDLECQLSMDRRAFFEKSAALRLTAQVLYSLEMEIAAQEAHLLACLRRTVDGGTAHSDVKWCQF